MDITILGIDDIFALKSLSRIIESMKGQSEDDVSGLLNGFVADTKQNISAVEVKMERLHIGSFDLSDFVLPKPKVAERQQIIESRKAIRPGKIAIRKMKNREHYRRKR